jgi:hypothetical protein
VTILSPGQMDVEMIAKEEGKEAKENVLDSSY